MEEQSRTSRNKPKKIEKRKKKRKIKFEKDRKGIGKFFYIFWKSFSNLFKILILLGIGVGVGGGLYGYQVFTSYQLTTPPLNIKLLENPVPSKIFDTEGNLLAEIGTEERVPVNSRDVPKSFYDALLSTEDSRYFQHEGFDLIGIGRAVVNNVIGGFGNGGGSTLTQQLIKLTFLDPDDTSLKRKTHEVTLANQLEEMFTKEEILEMYLNKIYMGNGVYGVETASNYYYGKTLAELTIPQQAFLAGLPQSPNGWDPYENPEGALNRRNDVLGRMLATESITETQYNEFVATDIMNGIIPYEEQEIAELNNIPDEYRYTIEQGIEEAIAETGLDPYRNGLNITISLNKDMQDFANKLANTEEIMAFPDDELMIAFTIIDNGTGRIVANGGGNRNSEIVPNGFNYATDLERQPASTMKPILSYAPAVEHLGYNAKTIINDVPYYYSNGMQVYNYDMQYRGPITMAHALAGSRNTTALSLMQAVGMDKAYGMANAMGLGFEDFEYVESGPLGSVSNASPLKMAQAYSTFANDGIYIPGHVLIEVTDNDGNVLYTEPEGTRVMSEYTAEQVTEMLMDSVTDWYGLYQNMNTFGNQMAVKSGTSNYDDYEKEEFGLWNGVPDYWLVAYTEDYTVAAWIGYDSRTTPMQTTYNPYLTKAVEEIFNKLGVRNTKFD